MEKTKIIVDTASDITIAQAEELNIELIPISITIKDAVFREEFDISKQDFWQILNQAEELPKTAQITPQTLFEAYCRLYREGYNRLIVVPINSQGSGTFHNAHLAVQMFHEEVQDPDVIIEVVDSGTYTYCYGRPVMLTAELLLQGKSFKEALKFLKQRLSRSHGYAYMGTLRFAKASGRISIVTAVMGEALGLKPVISIGNRKVDVIGKVRGEKSAIAKLIELVEQDAVNLEKEEIILVYGDIEKEIVDRIRAEILERLKPKAIFEGELGCCITNNAGPQTLGILFQGKDHKLYKS